MSRRKTSKSKKSKKEKGIASFAETLFTIISDPATDEYIRWGPNGDTFEVLSPHSLEVHVFGNYFRHSRFSSFQRQLYTYDVKREETVQGPNAETHFVFSHPFLRKGRRDLLHGVVRRAPADTKGAAKRAKDGKGENGGGTLSAKNQAKLDAMVKGWEREREGLWAEISGLKKANSKLIARVESLQTDNTQLWALVQAQEEGQELLKQGLKALFLHVAGGDSGSTPTPATPSVGPVGSMGPVGMDVGNTNVQWVDRLFSDSGQVSPAVNFLDDDDNNTSNTSNTSNTTTTTTTASSGFAPPPSAPLIGRKRKMETGTALSTTTTATTTTASMGGASSLGESGVEALRSRKRGQDREERYAPLMSPKLADLGGGASTLFGPPSTWSASGANGPSSTALISTRPTNSTANFKRNLGLAADLVLSSLEARAAERDGLFRAYQARHASFDAPLGINLGAATGTVSDVFNEVARIPPPSPLGSSSAMQISSRGGISNGSTVHSLEVGDDDDDDIPAVDLSAMEGVSDDDILDFSLQATSPILGLAATPSIPIPPPSSSSSSSVLGLESGIVPGMSLSMAPHGLESGIAWNDNDPSVQSMRLSPVETLSRSFSELSTDNRPS